jgi:5'-methylthioadenosine phosphorylase
MHGNSYALIATATDYDAWRPHTASVTAHDVLATLSANAATSRHVAATILQDLHTAVEQGLLDEERGGMQYSIMPRKGEERKEDVIKLGYVLPEYFKPKEEIL